MKIWRWFKGHAEWVYGLIFAALAVMEAVRGSWGNALLDVGAGLGAVFALVWLRRAQQLDEERNERLRRLVDRGEDVTP